MTITKMELNATNELRIRKSPQIWPAQQDPYVNRITSPRMCANTLLKQALAPRIQRASERWPYDALRPDCQFQEALAKRLAAGNIAPPGVSFSNQAAKQAAELKQANAIDALLGDRFKFKVSGHTPKRKQEVDIGTQYPISKRTLEPKTNPAYFKDLIAELEAAPTRSWLVRIKNKLTGMIRLK